MVTRHYSHDHEPSFPQLIRAPPYHFFLQPSRLFHAQKAFYSPVFSHKASLSKYPQNPPTGVHRREIVPDFIHCDPLLNLLKSASEDPPAMSSPHLSNPLTYQPPGTEPLAHLPSSWVPYAELIHIFKPVGIYYFYYPFLFGTLFTAILSPTRTEPLKLFFLIVQLLFSAFLDCNAAIG